MKINTSSIFVTILICLLLDFSLAKTTKKIQPKIDKLFSSQGHDEHDFLARRDIYKSFAHRPGPKAVNIIQRHFFSEGFLNQSYCLIALEKIGETNGLGLNNITFLQKILYKKYNTFGIKVLNILRFLRYRDNKFKTIYRQSIFYLIHLPELHTKLAYQIVQYHLSHNAFSNDEILSCLVTLLNKNNYSVSITTLIIEKMGRLGTFKQLPIIVQFVTDHRIDKSGGSGLGTDDYRMYSINESTITAINKIMLTTAVQNIL
ncbi:MAG: hypothetical protein CVV64_20555 [Candidatus Wallbacteria bacterium HGW-Wallbacteria-1]|jgi:hypothetical protein|uniref:Uncharacterized protein n=1 Tax=Candidatus Wallbacteria bacterium HGW-Wallbacteria-1 TaxID=2013854 RepID=A0A2N1PI87_9BACT|nr:MAG: hypothetical protein CVV64_20555 [Candidatus Wallbacteria bacterium HGW-Wallbacteria-1]